MPWHFQAIILALTAAVIVLTVLLARAKRTNRSQACAPRPWPDRFELPPPASRPEPRLTRVGPHTVEVLENTFTYHLPIPTLEEFEDVKISLLLPTRNRPELVRTSLNSVMELASEPASLQIILRCDRDDLSMAGFEFPACGHFKLLRGDRMRGYRSLHYFYTECAMHASGPLLLLWNDDAQMRTPGWDAELWRTTADRRTHGLHGFWSLANNHWPYAFPVITRSIVERLGAFARIAYNDAYLFELAKACGIEQQVLESIRVQHDMLPDAAGDGLSLSLYKSGFFQELIDADARTLMKT